VIVALELSGSNYARRLDKYAVGDLADEPQFSVALGKATVGSALTKPRQHPARFADMAEAD
jgi:hypothetical protein